MHSSHASFIFGWEVDAFTENGHVVASENFVLFVTVLCCCIIAQHYVRNSNIKSIPESLATIIISATVSGALSLVIKPKMEFSPLVIGFSPEVFYFGLLPPIIFSSAYHLRRKLLYGNLGAVLVLAFLGTAATAAIITVGILYLQARVTGSPTLAVMEGVAFSCAVAATDPVSTLAIFSQLQVSPSLYYAVLGESVLNDAVAITAFKVASRLVGTGAFTTIDALACVVNFFVLVLGSTVIGYAFAVLVAYLLRHIDFGRNKVAPVAVVICAMYIPFFLTEMLQLSGIVTVFFSGIAARRYIHKNLSSEVQKLAGFIFHLIAHVSETSCFVLLGLSVFLLPYAAEQWPFMGCMVVLCVVARPLAVYPLLLLLNQYRACIHPAPGPPAPLSPSSIDRRFSDSTASQLEAGYGGLSPTPRESVTSPKPGGTAGAPIGAPTGDGAARRLTEPLPSSAMHVIAFAGMRGAVSYSLAYVFPDTNGNRNVVLCTTILVVMVTCIAQGMLMEPLIRWLGVPTGVDMASFLKERTSPAQDASGFERWLLYPFVVKPRRGAYQSIPSPQPEVRGAALSVSPAAGSLPPALPRAPLLTITQCLPTPAYVGDTLSSGGGTIVSADQHSHHPPSTAWWHGRRRGNTTAMSSLPRHWPSLPQPRSGIPRILPPHRRSLSVGAAADCDALEMGRQSFLAGYLPAHSSHHTSQITNDGTAPAELAPYNQVMHELQTVLRERSQGLSSSCQGTDAAHRSPVFNHLSCPNRYSAAAELRLLQGELNALGGAPSSPPAPQEPL